VGSFLPSRPMQYLSILLAFSITFYFATVLSLLSVAKCWWAAILLAKNLDVYLGPDEGEESMSRGILELISTIRQYSFSFTP
jgi:hypothetical protein